MVDLRCLPPQDDGGLEGGPGDVESTSLSRDNLSSLVGRLGGIDLSRFDSSIILILKGGIITSLGDLPES